MSVLHLPSGLAAGLWSGPVPDELDQGPSVFVLFQQPKLVLHQQLAHTNRHVEEKQPCYIEPGQLRIAYTSTNMSWSYFNFFSKKL